MNCLYIFRGSGNSLPQFTNSSIWMYGKEYRPPDPTQDEPSQASEDVADVSLNISSLDLKQQDSFNNNNNNSNNTTSTSTTSNNNNNDNNNNNNVNNNDNFITDFLQDFANKLWFSYRQGFSFIGDSIYENDCGWGCMLRSGQMLLSNVLLLNQIGKGWKKTNNQDYPEEFYNTIKMFLDRPTAPFSIHNIALHGQNQLGKTVGEWFGPSNISNAIKTLVYRNMNQCNISVFVSEDGSLYVDQLLEIALKDDGTWVPLLILIPTKLGIDTINELYYRPLLQLYTFPQSLGIVGGKPRASLYFIASQDDNLFYLDPHSVQQSIESDEFNLSSYFCNIPKKTNISEVDPSLVLPFFCSTKEEFLDFLERSKTLELSSEFPLYNVSEKAPNYLQENISFDEEEDSSDDIDFEKEYHLL